MYTLSEVVEIDTAQNLILNVTAKDRTGSDDVEERQPFADADFDE